MTIADFPLHPRALTAFQAQPEADQNLILQELSRWWNQPRSQWPADRLLPWSAQLGREIFCIDDRFGIVVRWYGSQAAEVMTILRRTVEVFPTEPKTPVLRNPDSLLALGVAAITAGVVFMLLSWVFGAPYFRNYENKADSPWESPLLGAMSCLCYLIGIFALLRRVFHIR